MEILTSSLSFSKGKWLYSGALTDQTDSIFLSLSFREGKHFLAVYGVLSAAQDFNFILLAHDKAEDFFPLEMNFLGNLPLQIYLLSMAVGHLKPQFPPCWPLSQSVPSSGKQPKIVLPFTAAQSRALRSLHFRGAVCQQISLPLIATSTH